MSKRRAQRRAEQRREGETGGGGQGAGWIYWVLGGALLIAAISVGVNVFTGMGSGAMEPVELEGLDDPQELVEFADPVELGDPDAPVTIVEFADYQCPACQQYASQVLPSVKSQLVDEGRVRYRFYDFPLVEMHQNAFYAARAARCAGEQERYWDYHDELFLHQSTWAASGNPRSHFTGYADDLGLDVNDFESCLRSDRYADVVTANQMLGRQLGVSGTPTIFVDRGDGAAIRVQEWTFANILAAVEGESDG